jgi:hypothetical protein
MPTTEPLLTVLLGGEPLISFDRYGRHTYGAAAKRLREPLDVGNRLGTEVERLEQLVACGSVNPYRDALIDSKRVHAAIPKELRAAIRVKDVSYVMDAIAKLAKEKTQ